jgi:nucleotide-binding universal stress UspA family protein
VTKILFAYDGSEQSKRALRYARRLGAGDSVIVLSVENKLIEAPPTEAFTEPGHDPERLRKELEEVREILGDAGVQADFISKIGNPAAEILNTAESGDVGLIVIGRQGTNAVERFLLGSVADRVVQHALCDVLVVT